MTKLSPVLLLKKARSGRSEKEVLEDSLTMYLAAKKRTSLLFDSIYRESPWGKNVRFRFTRTMCADPSLPYHIYVDWDEKVLIENRNKKNIEMRYINKCWGDQYDNDYYLKGERAHIVFKSDSEHKLWLWKLKKLDKMGVGFGKMIVSLRRKLGINTTLKCRGMSV